MTKTGIIYRENSIVYSLYLIPTEYIIKKNKNNTQEAVEIWLLIRFFLFCYTFPLRLIFFLFYITILLNFFSCFFHLDFFCFLSFQELLPKEKKTEEKKKKWRMFGFHSRFYPNRILKLKVREHFFF